MNKVKTKLLLDLLPVLRKHVNDSKPNSDGYEHPVYSLRIRILIYAYYAF